MVEYEIYPLPIAKMRVSKGYMTYLMNYEKDVDVITYSWYIKGTNKNMIVDTGAPKEIILKSRPVCEDIFSFEDALEKVSLKPEDIDIVIQTHLHYDHCANTHKCVNAKVIVQESELKFALAPHPLMAKSYDRELISKLKFNIIHGDKNIDDGIELLYTPGHSPGSQSVAIETAEGKAIITGFCCNKDCFEMPKDISGYTFEDIAALEALWPVRAPGIHTDALQAFDSALRIKGLADILIPIHDPMFEKVEKIPGNSR